VTCSPSSRTRPTFARCAPTWPPGRLDPALQLRAITITAAADPGHDYDFVSRFFSPADGISEVPVTGIAHTALAPYWAARLGRSRLTGLQASARAGLVRCAVQGERVHLSGHAITRARRDASSRSASSAAFPAAIRSSSTLSWPTGRPTKPGGDLMSSLGNFACARVLGRRHGAALLKPLPEPADLARHRVRRRPRVRGLINEYHLAA
jgi:hypothetical protein